jgi:succinate dehydrogenase / fumarate reductase cytochrome b subunit
MNKHTVMIFSSVGRKFVMAITGLFLCTFLVVHLSGNLLLFKNDGGASGVGV